MPKADFEFYRIDGFEGEFVRPAPASDPYHGAYNIPAIPGLALAAIAKLVNDSVGACALETTEAKPEATTGYFFNTKLAGCEVIRQKATVTVGLDEENGYYSSAFNDLYHELSAGPGEIIIPSQKEAADIREPARVTASREYVAIENSLFLLDEDEAPVHPTMLVRQVVPIRAYRWLPGPERKGKNATLPATYSPRPVNLAAAQLIEIKGINPLATQ